MTSRSPDTAYVAAQLQPEEIASAVTGTELGLRGWTAAGHETFGATFGKALAFARQEMRKALGDAVDEITHEWKPADPMGALDRLVYDLMTIAVEGLPTVAEMPPLEEVSWTAKKPPTRQDMIVSALHAFLLENDAARLTKDGVAFVADPVAGVYTYSSDAMMRAVKRIEANAA